LVAAHKASVVSVLETVWARLVIGKTQKNSTNQNKNKTIKPYKTTGTYAYSDIIT